MPQIDVTMQGVGRQFAKMSSEIEALLLDKQVLLEKVAELKAQLEEKSKKKKEPIKK